MNLVVFKCCFSLIMKRFNLPCQCIVKCPIDQCFTPYRARILKNHRKQVIFKENERERKKNKKTMVKDETGVIEKKTYFMLITQND